MNYIKRLEMEVVERDKELQAYKDMVAELKSYLDLPKFKGDDNWVSVQDVLNRLEVRND